MPQKCERVADLVKLWHDTRGVLPCFAELENSFKAKWRTKKNIQDKDPFQRNEKLMAEIDRRARLRLGEGESLTLRLRLAIAEEMDADARLKFPSLGQQTRFTRIRSQYDTAGKAGKKPAVESD